MLQRCDSSLLFTDLYNNMKILILTAKVAILCHSVARYYFEGHLQCKSRDKKIGWHSSNHNLRNTSFEPYQTAWSYHGHIMVISNSMELTLLQRCDSSLLFTDLYNNMKILILTAKVAILCHSVARYYFEGHLQCKSRDKKIGWHSSNHNLRNTSFEPYQTAWSFYLTGP